MPGRAVEKTFPPNTRARLIDLTAERHEVRETVKKNTYTGKTYNSLENISQFFAERGIKAGGPAYPPRKDTPPAPVAPVSKPQAPRKKGSTVEHPKYGRGEVLRLEGSGDDTKVTVNFRDYGLKKLIAKYAGIKVE